MHKIVLPAEVKNIPPVVKEPFYDGYKAEMDGVNLAQLFFEEGDEPVVVEEEEEDIDMGNLFGDDDDY